MGLFGTDTQNIAISTNAGKSSAEIQLPIPFWEIVIIAVIVMLIILISKNMFKNYFEKQVSRQAKIAVISDSV
jgi:hypothetical protein